MRWSSVNLVISYACAAIFLISCGPGPKKPLPTPTNFGTLSIILNGGATATNNINGTLIMFAKAGSEVYLTHTPGCASGSTWTPFSLSPQTVTLLANQSNTYYFKVRENGEESECKGSNTVIHDDIAPVVAITSPTTGGYVNAANVAAFTVSGTCSDNGRAVTITGLGTATCTAGAFSVTGNLTPAAQGAMSFTASQTDIASNVGSSAVLALTKDTIVPTGSFTIENGAAYTQNVNVNLQLTLSETGEFYATSIAGCTSGGAWTPMTASSAFTLPNANANNTVYVQYRDLAGNKTACLSQSIIHDNIPATLTFAAPLDNTYVNAANVSAVTLSGACSENGRFVTLTGDYSASIACTGGAWSTVANLTSLPDGPVSITAAHIDAAGNAATPVVKNLIKDVGIPTLALSSPTSGSYINAANVNAVVFSGTCSENTRSVAISGAVTSSATCTGGAWTKTLNLSALAEGAVQLRFNHDDAAGNTATEVVANYTKDTVIPTGSFMIENGATQTGNTHVTLQLTSSGATQVYITYTAGCASGGTWNAVSATAGWDLLNLNANNDVYLKYRDDADNQTACLHQSIYHDDTPTLLTFVAPASNAVIGTAQIGALVLSGTCSESGQAVTFTGDYAGSTTCTAGAWTKTVNLSGLSDGAVSIVAHHADILNNSVTAAKNFVKDTAAPTLALTSPVNGSYVNAASASAFTVTGTCSEDTRNVVITGAVSATAVCASGVWSKALDLSALAQGAVALHFNHADAGGNAATQVDVTYTKDTIAPTGSFLIENGLAQTNSVHVNLQLTTAGAATEVYVTQSSALCLSGGIWSAVAASVGWDLGTLNGTNTVYVKYRDAALNESSCYSQSIVHDNLPPALTFATPSDNGYVNMANANAVVLSGTCSENTRNVVLTGSYAGTAVCTSGLWTKTVDLSAVADGALTITANHSDSAGNAAPAIVKNLTKDTVVPTLTLTAPTAGSYINSNNVSAFTVSGACSENGGTVVLSGAVSGSGTCASGAWSATLNMTAPAQGTVNVRADLSDAAGNSATQVSINYTKDTLAPTSNSISINGAATYTTVATVTLTLGSTGATQMYITDDSACASGGSWQTYATSKPWVLGDDNNTVAVYVKYRDAAQNETACINDTIIHDDTPPTWDDVPDHVPSFASLTASPLVTYPESATDANGILKYQYAIGTGTSGAAASDKKAWTDVTGGTFTATGLTLVNGSTYYVNMRVFDPLNNETDQSSTGWLVDTTPPSLTITTPVNNSIFTEQDVFIKGACENGLTINIVYPSNVTGPATATCTALAYSFAVRISGGSAVKTISINQFDGASTTTATVNIDFRRALNFDGTVLTQVLMPDGSKILGGSFNRVFEDRDMSIVRTDVNGLRDAGFVASAGFNGIVYGAAALPGVGYIVVGEFTTYQGQPANRIAKIDLSGNLDLTFNPPLTQNGANGIARAVAVSGTSIYVGGDFSKYRNVTATRIVKLDYDGAMDTTFNGPGTGLNNSVYTLGVNNGYVYAGGAFTTYQGAAANRIAKIHATSGALDTVFNPATSSDNGVNSNVRAIGFVGTDVLIGGEFTTWRGVTCKKLIWVSETAVINNTPLGASVNNNVNAIYVTATNIYVGGAFTSYKGAVANRIAKLSLAGAMDTTFNPTTSANNGMGNGTVFAIYSDGSNVYAAGSFSLYRSANAPRVVKIQSSGAQDTTYSPTSMTVPVGAGGTINAIVGTAEGIVLAGAVVTYRAVGITNGIAKLNSSGVLDTTFSPQSGANGFNAAVRSLALNGTTLYVGGDFTTYKGAPANYIAKLDANGALDTTFNPSSGSNGANNVVRAVATSGSDLFIGGDFTTYRGTAAVRLAKINAANGLLNVAFATATGLNNSAYALATNGTDLYVGGVFTTHKSLIANRLAKVDYNTGDLDQTFNPQTGGNAMNPTGTVYVYSLVMSATGVYAGGTFSIYRGASGINRVAKINTDGSLDATFSHATGANSSVYGLFVDGSDLYMVGALTTYKGVTAKGLARANASTGAITSSFTSAGGVDSTSGAAWSIMKEASGKMSVGGAFTRYRNQPWINQINVNISNGAP